MSRGGPVIWWLAVLVLMFWLIAFERIIYLAFTYPKQKQQWLDAWKERQDHQSWFARKQRNAWLSQAHLQLFKNVNLLKLLIGLFPMLGLLGTVTGMISVFDVLEAEGTAQPRLMAAGISMATLPTMAGMVAALAGFFCYSRLMAAIEKREIHLEKLMRSRA
ncbi:MotA/TolQ/ExbB proton channel family protein [Vibrio sp. RC27]